MTTDLITNKSSISEVRTRLHKYLFPVETRKVFFESNPSPIYSSDYISIVRPDTNKLISVMNSTYKMKTNEEVLLPVIERLNTLDTNWYLDNSHSFVQDARMKLQITFPDMTLNDGKSDIAMSLFLHNSYNGSEGVRMLFGAIRAICTNGMVFGKVLGKFYARHTKNIDVSDLEKIVVNTFDSIPLIKQRIEILQNLSSAEITDKTIEDEFGTKALKYVKSQSFQTQYALLNAITYYISHYVQQHMRTQYQLRVSRMFNF